MDIIQVKCCEGLACLRNDDCIPILVAQSELGKGGFGRRAAMQALAEVGQERSDGHARIIRERFVVLLDDPDFRVRLQTIASLQAPGDPRACGALQAIVDKGSDSRLTRRSREAIRGLGERASEPSPSGDAPSSQRRRGGDKRPLRYADSSQAAL